ncbi:2-isopropylmalate synthase [Dissulfurirhabdus thermomarina]|uniref:2-isopropylmalate synthase n=1 Tax=Dissulfurirhabdus thermomarina TaxID=1765737 RepID=A0A6N9TJA6_DISTH|nr:2-isopropylmalate synthase [Dissulfurirhabdus thermomarina]NDY41342.1 2-isopropylmalate synthase [Dissulfurirhabdus thermomarina]NMX23275.1 2-isopropylmalate synthase [Dissulfurirhabdus thermomarina]
MAGDADKILIFDTTLRDGEQSPGVSLNMEEKLQIGRQLEKLGVDVLEAGFPVASPGDFEGVQRLARELRGVQVAALARAVEKDIDTAWEAVRDGENPRIHIFIATSDIHLKHKLRMNREEVLERAAAAVRHAARYTGNVEFSAEDATRSDLDFLCRVFEAVIEAGATTVNFPDTVGYAVPWDFARMIRRVAEHTPNIHKAVLSVHCHNDLGLATANVLSAVANGARQVECTVNGIGERAGNTAMEEVVMAIRTRKDLLPFSLGIDTRHILATSRMVSHLTGMVVQPNKAIVGANAFAHESGIHQDGVLKERTTYEIMDPRDIGLTGGAIVLGKHSGRHALKAKLEEMGYRLAEDDLDRVFARFKNLADRKKDVFDEDLEALVAEVVLRIPDRYRLVYLHVAGGSGIRPTATVGVEVDGREAFRACMGAGPIDAAYKAVAELTGTKSRLLRFTVSSITGGTDAQGEVTVRLEEDGLVVSGQGADPDIITASVRAYLNALNRLEYKKKNAAAPGVGAMCRTEKGSGR